MSEGTSIDPESVRANAASLEAAAARLDGAWKNLNATISSLNGAHPWGTDDPGKEFNKDYTSGEQYATKTLEAAATLIERVRHLVTDVDAAALGVVDTDQLIAKWFGDPGESG